MEKLIIYQVFTRLFGANANKNVSNGSKRKTVVARWLISQEPHSLKSRN